MSNSPNICLSFLVASWTIFFCVTATATTTKENAPIYCEADGPIPAAQVPQFVDVLFDLELTFEDLCYAEKMLDTGPMKEVCAALFPLIELRYTEEHWCPTNNLSPEAFKACPYPWPSVHAAWRIFGKFLDLNTGPISAQFAREAIPDARYRLLRPYLMRYLAGQWNEESETIARSLLEDFSSGYDTRRMAADVLFDQNPWKYYEPFLQLCATEHGNLRTALVELLVYKSRTLKMDPDERLIRLAVEIIEQDYYRALSDLRTAYALAGSLNSYLGTNIKLSAASGTQPRSASQVNDKIRRKIDASLHNAHRFLLDLEKQAKPE